MERVRTLINKLQEQLEEGAEAGRLLITTQMLLAELQQQSPLARSKVSVVIPGVARMPVPTSLTPKERVEPLVPETVPQPVIMPPMPQQVAVPDPLVSETLPEHEPEIEPIPTPLPPKGGVEPIMQETPQEAVLLPEPIQKAEEIELHEKEPEVNEPFMKEPASWVADTINVVPTLTHQPRREAMELNETMVAQDESINDRLREKRVEVATSLQGGPVKDIRKAIGINDRYLFINELFRGDEPMYERSLKTINSYSFLPEAEYWIQRELKIKLGWDEDSATVQHFDQLVKRRFV